MHELKDVQYYINDNIGGGFQQMALHTIRVSSTLIWFSLKLGLCVDAVKF